MDKEFILRYLKKEHLAGNSDLSEIAEISGLDVVKTLIKNHETMRMCYIPMLANNKELMCDVIRKNKDKMTVNQLASVTGFTRRKVERMIAEIEMKD